MQWLLGARDPAKYLRAAGSSIHQPYLVIFIDVKLYAESTFLVFYWGMAGYGFSRRPVERRTSHPLAYRNHAIAIVAIALGTALPGGADIDDVAQPLVDAFTTTVAIRNLDGCPTSARKLALLAHHRRDLHALFIDRGLYLPLSCLDCIRDDRLRLAQLAAAYRANSSARHAITRTSAGSLSGFASPRLIPPDPTDPRVASGSV